MGVFDCPVTLECKYAAEEWLQSKDPLIRDFGARLMFLLRSQEVNLEFSRTSKVPPSDLLPGEFQQYRWDASPLKTSATHKGEFQTETPMRHFHALEDVENVGLKLGVFWVSPHWLYPAHEHQSLELHHRVLGQGTYFTGQDEISKVPLAPGDCYVHLPHQLHGIESQDEPLLTLWAERVVTHEEVPRVLSDLYTVAKDPVTCTLSHAARLWLQSEDPHVQLFGRKLLPFISPRSVEQKRVGVDAPPLGMLPDDFRGCPWYPSGAYTCRMDPTLKPLKDCIIYKGEHSMFGFFYLPPGIYYPAHRHEPLEMYHVISGEARFFLADDGEELSSDVTETCIKTWGPDSFWLHLPYQSHGMQTLDRPVLILWGWIGNLKDYDFHYLPSDIFQSAKAVMAKL